MLLRLRLDHHPSEERVLGSVKTKRAAPKRSSQRDIMDQRGEVMAGGRQSSFVVVVDTAVLRSFFFSALSITATQKETSPTAPE